jgi:hypothetical protein
MASKADETRDALLDAIKNATEGIVQQYNAAGQLGALAALSKSYRYVMGGDMPLDLGDGKS